MQAVVADRGAPESAAWAVRSGRLLRFGPDWPESDDRLTFDACSGDYWVLDALGQLVVQRLIDRGAQSTAQLKAAASPMPGLAGGVDELEPALARLLEAGLIQAAHASVS